MFNNIGMKIKKLATALTWIGISFFVIIGIVVMAITSEFNAASGVLSGFLIMAICSLFSWISSFLLYGFGELIDNTAQIAGKKFGEAPKVIKPKLIIQSTKASEGKCGFCGKENKEVFSVKYAGGFKWACIDCMVKYDCEMSDDMV